MALVQLTLTCVTLRGIQTAIYCRISNDPRVTRLGVRRQEDDCRELVSRRGWALADVYLDNDLSAYSGERRPAYRRLLEDIRQGLVQALVAWDPDRLHRSLVELEEFIEIVETAGCRVETVQTGELDFSTPSGRMVARMLGAAARYESEHKAERLRRKHIELATAGKNAGAGRCFGFDFRQGRIEVIDHEAELIREATSRVLTGESLGSVCRDWNSRGIKTARGNPWRVVSLKRLLVSARISGRRDLTYEPDGSRPYIPRIVGDATWPAIISIEDSDRLRNALADLDRRRRAPRTHLLTGGIALCGVCGARLQARHLPSGHRMAGQAVLICRADSAIGGEGCGGLQVAEEPVNDLVSEAVLRAIDSEAMDSLFEDGRDDHASQELLVVEERMSELARQWATGDLTRSEWQVAREALRGQQIRLQRQIQASDRNHSLRLVQQPIRVAWPDLALHHKRAVIAVVVEHVIVNRARGRGPRVDPSRIEIRWRT